MAWYDRVLRVATIEFDKQLRLARDADVKHRLFLLRPMARVIWNMVIGRVVGRFPVVVVNIITRVFGTKGDPAVGEAWYEDIVRAAGAEFIRQLEIERDADLAGRWGVSKSIARLIWGVILAQVQIAFMTTVSQMIENAIPIHGVNDEVRG